MKNLCLIFSGALLMSFFIGCGDSSDPEPEQEQQGSLSLALTDAPVDDATEVVVKFNAIEIKPADLDSFTITFDETQSIDLLSLQNGETAALLENRSLRAGQYNWLRLDVDAEQGVIDSYIRFEDDSTYSLHVPGEHENGLKLVRPFIIAAGEHMDFTIDFDLRKSVVKPNSPNQDYKLKPTLRLVDNTEVGRISGYIESQLVSDESCEQGLAIYAYSGADISPDDEGSPTPPISTSIPYYDIVNDRYNYRLSFLLEGDYTLALTCDAENDEAESNEDEASWSAIATAQASVVVDQTSQVNFLYQSD